MIYHEKESLVISAVFCLNLSSEVFVLFEPELAVLFHADTAVFGYGQWSPAGAVREVEIVELELILTSGSFENIHNGLTRFLV